MIGQTVSHYRIIEKLGEGGMGVVYKAEDLKLDRFVALKFLPRQLSADHETKARFIHEAKSASSLDHPNICAIHEIDETSDGQTFIVMPCYEGETLKEKIKRGQLGVDEAIDIVIQVGSGLAKAHEKGIVHRDIKPGNIVLTEDGQVKLVDFGVAKLAGQTTLTKTGARVGTVGYMSPEQVLGEALDARSDVFSLGVVMYELLAGKLPFQGEHEAAILYSIIHVNPPPLYVYRRDVPEVVAEIIDRALAKVAGERYADAGELVQDLEAVRAELRVGRPLPTRRRRRGAKLRLGRRGAVSIAAAVVIAVVALRLLWWPPAFSPSEALAVVDFRDLATADDPTTSAGMTNLVHTGLVESTPGVRVISPEYLHDLRRRLFDSARGPIDADQALEVAREAEASLLLSGQMGTIEGAPYVTWQLVEVATGKSLAAGRMHGANQGLIADQIIKEMLPLLAVRSGVEAPAAPRSVSDLTTSSPEAYQHYVTGILAAEEAREVSAMRELEQAVKLDSTFALAFFELSQLQINKESAKAYADRAWKLRTRLGVQDRMRLEAWRQRVDGDDAEAIRTYRESLARWPDDRKVLADLSAALHMKWRFAEAADVAGDALFLYPDDATARVIYPRSLDYIGRSREALAATKTSVERHPADPHVWHELGLLYLSTGLPDSAETAFNEALEIDPQFVHSKKGLGYCDYLRGDIDGAIEIFESIIGHYELSEADSISIFTGWAPWPGLAMLYAESGRFEKALWLVQDAEHAVLLSWGAAQTKQRIQLLRRNGRAREAIDIAQGLLARATTPFEKLSAKHLWIRTLVAVDSLDAARAAATELRGDENADASGPFLRLRVETDIALAEGNYDQALGALAEMARHGVPRGGLPDIERRESLARALHGARRSKEALEVLRELLRMYGSHAESHYQLGLICEDMGRSKEAKTEYEAFLTAWAKADDGLPQVTDARARLNALTTGGR